MGRIRSKNTKFERLVIDELRRRGAKFRTHYAKLPGKPDIVHPGNKIVIFLDSDFWHGWRFPTWKNTLSVFWAEKITANRRRDHLNTLKLKAMGWRVIRVWEHQLAKRHEQLLQTLEEATARR